MKLMDMDWEHIVNHSKDETIIATIEKHIHVGVVGVENDKFVRCSNPRCNIQWEMLFK